MSRKSTRRSIPKRAPTPPVIRITTMTMMTTIIMIEPERDEKPHVPTGSAGLLRLLAWLSPAFPTGAYAYSHGLEWAVETHDIRDGATLLGWLAAVIAHGTGRN